MADKEKLATEAVEETQAEAPTINLDDAETWGDDPGAVMDVIERKWDEGTEPEEVEAKATEPATESESGSESPASEPEPQGGERLVPVKALSEVRAENQALKDRLAALEQQAQAREQQLPATATTEQETEPEPDPKSWEAQRERLEARITEIEGDDPEMAEALRGQIVMGDRVDKMERRMEHQQEQARQRAVSADEEARDLAFASAPLLQAWEEDDKHPEFRNAARQLHAQLIADRDGAYAQMDWQQRFAALPGMVEAMLGVSPHRARLEPQGQPKPARKPKPEAPWSSSEIPGGQAKDPAPRSLDDLSHLPDAESSAALAELADSDPEGLYRMLERTSFGNVNNPRARRAG